jgi:hypothetical protein
VRLSIRIIYIERVISGRLQGKRGTILISLLEGVAEIKGTMGTSRAEMVIGAATTELWARMSNLEGGCLQAVGVMLVVATREGKMTEEGWSREILI